PRYENYCDTRIGGRSSAWLEPQIVDLAVAGSNPVGHPNPNLPQAASVSTLDKPAFRRQIAAWLQCIPRCCPWAPGRPISGYRIPVAKQFLSRTSKVPLRCW